MASPRVTLRPFERGDFEPLIAWATTPERLMQWAGVTFAYPLDGAQLDGYLAGSRAAAPDHLAFTAEAGGHVVGHICLNAIDRVRRSGTLSRVLVLESARGGGVCTPMVDAALEVAFRDLRLHRVDLTVFDFNAAAIACYERAGFSVEGRLRDLRRLRDGEYWTALVMSILEDEWRRGAPGRR